MSEKLKISSSDLGVLLKSSCPDAGAMLGSVPSTGRLTPPARPTYTIDELATRDELLKSYRQEAECLESDLREEATKFNSLASSARAQVLRLEEQLRKERRLSSEMSWDLRVAKESEAVLKKFLTEQVSVLRKDSFKEAAKILFKKLLKTYLEANMQYFRDVGSVSDDVELLPEWVDFFAKGAGVAFPQKPLSEVGGSFGRSGDAAPTIPGRVAHGSVRVGFIPIRKPNRSCRFFCNANRTEPTI